MLAQKNFGPRKNFGPKKDFGQKIFGSIKVANGSLVQHMGTIPGRVGSGRVGSARLTCDYKAISVQLQLQLPTGTELGNLFIKVATMLI